jgi:hypothetical protein
MTEAETIQTKWERAPLACGVWRLAKHIRSSRSTRIQRRGKSEALKVVSRAGDDGPRDACGPPKPSEHSEGHPEQEHTSFCAWLKEWIRGRLDWIDSQGYPGPVVQIVGGGNTTPLPLPGPGGEGVLGCGFAALGWSRGKVRELMTTRAVLEQWPNFTPA